MEKLIGPVTILDLFASGQLDAVYLCYRGSSALTQEPRVELLLPLSAERMQATEGERRSTRGTTSTAQARVVIDALITRYIEALVYRAWPRTCQRAVGAHGGDEGRHRQRHRPDAEFKLIYNKQRQAAITKELSEIVGGAATISG
jgi:F-type H+-transporting ATPase subunit gamma